MIASRRVPTGAGERDSVGRARVGRPLTPVGSGHPGSMVRRNCKGEAIGTSSGWPNGKRPAVSKPSPCRTLPRDRHRVGGPTLDLALSSSQRPGTRLERTRLVIRADGADRRPSPPTTERGFNRRRDALSVPSVEREAPLYWQSCNPVSSSAPASNMPSQGLVSISPVRETLNR